MSDWLDIIRKKAPSHCPANDTLDQAEAGVLMAITDHPEPHIVLTQRAMHLNSHAGEVAFPGGKREHQDSDIIETALRESHEEICLAPMEVEVVSPMPPSVSKMGLKVVPILGIIPHHADLLACEDEIASIFKVPIRFFLDNPVEQFTEREHEGVRYRIPCYRYEGYEIWGLTAYFITDCFNRLFDTGLDMPVAKPISGSNRAS